MDRARIKNAVVVIALLGAIWLISSKVSPPDSIMLKNFTGLNAGIRSPLENISRAYQAPVYSKEVAELLKNKPSNAGYIKGHPLHNTNGRAYVLLDNRGNDFDVLVKLVYLGTDVVYPARQVFIPAGQQFKIQNVSLGQYDIRFRNLSNGAIQATPPFRLTEERTAKGIKTQSYSLTLYGVPQGRLRLHPLSEEYF